METTQATRKDNNTEQASLYMGFELADKKWKLAFGEGSRERQREIDADEKERVWEEIERAKKRFSLGDDLRIVGCYVSMTSALPSSMAFSGLMLS